MNWIWLLIVIAVLMALSAVLAKFGLKNADASAGAFIRTLVIGVFTWVMFFVGGDMSEIGRIGLTAFLLTLLSGAMAGLFAVFFTMGLKGTGVHKIAGVERLSVVFYALLSFLFFREEPAGVFATAGLAALLIGAYLMISGKSKGGIWEIVATAVVVFAAVVLYSYFGGDMPSWAKIAIWVIFAALVIFYIVRVLKGNVGGKWLLFSALSALFAAGAYFVNIRYVGGDSMLYSGLRLLAAVVVTLIFVLSGKWGKLRGIPGDGLLFLLLSGGAVAGAWYFYLRTAVVGMPSYISLLGCITGLTVLFSALLLKEKITARVILGTVITVGGLFLLRL